MKYILLFTLGAVLVLGPLLYSYYLRNKATSRNSNKLWLLVLVIIGSFVGFLSLINKQIDPDTKLTSELSDQSPKSYTSK